MAAAKSKRPHRIRTAVGISLIVINVPVAYLGLLVGALASIYDGEAIWLLAGVGAYAFSWVLFGAGIALAGQQGLTYARRWRRYRTIMRLRELRARKRHAGG